MCSNTQTDMNAKYLGSTIEKRVLESKKIFISGPITLKMLCQVRLEPKSPNLCLDFKQLDGKEGQKSVQTHKRTLGMVGTIEKKGH